ncbi:MULTISPECIES: sulfotransferase [unclassified Mesorhizobium]
MLVHNLGDGWEPLCLHLGVAVPDQSYPNRNNTKEFQSALAQN